MRASKQRDLILEVVRGTFEHPTAEWVYRETRRHLPKIGLATVYRNLKALAGAGLIAEVRSSTDEALRYDGNTGEHYHIRCVSCERVSDLPVSVERDVEIRAARATNYQVLSHQLEVAGVCPACQVKTGRHRNKKNSQLVSQSSQRQ